MDKVIILPAGNDKLVIKQVKKDWFSVYVITPSGQWLLGHEGWAHIAEKWLIHVLRMSYENKMTEPQCLLMVSDPHGAAYLKKEVNYDTVFFQGKDAPRVFHTMILSHKEKQQWIDILKKAVADKV